MSIRREQFLNELERLLCNISREERDEAMAFYRSYFEDAGENNEENIIKELESPEKVAESICESLGDETASAEERYGQNLAYRNVQYSGNMAGAVQTPQKKETNVAAVILLVVVLVLTSPIWLSVLAVLLAVLATVGAVVISALVAGVVIAVASFTVMAAGSTAAGFLSLGIAFLLLALGILVGIACVWILGKGVPALCKGTAKLVKKIV